MMFVFCFSERYAEQVNPLLIQAQRKLIKRVQEYGGHAPQQPHMLQAMDAAGGPITPKLYLHLKLNVGHAKEHMSELDPGAHIDPDGHDAYSGMEIILQNWYIFQASFPEK